MLNIANRHTAAYIVGVALGDGNLSNPNGRAVRLRITCDKKYPTLIDKIANEITHLAPYNKVTKVNKGANCLDISCYSNDWEKLLGWKAGGGSKLNQNVSVPMWILRNKKLSKRCICGLFETDGSIYKDRNYLTANFVTQIPNLANSVKAMLTYIGYKYSMQTLPLPSGKTKFTFRIHKDVDKFIRDIGIEKK